MEEITRDTHTDLWEKFRRIPKTVGRRVKRVRNQNEKTSLLVVGDLCWSNLEALTGSIFDLSCVSKMCQTNLIFLCVDLTLDEV
jgi:hypothetical protein